MGKAKFAPYGVLIGVVGCWAIAWSGCSTTQVDPLPGPPEPPHYVKVPHPDGLDGGDLIAIFTDGSAPPLESLKACDSDYFRLREMTNSKEELIQGAREFVRTDPVKYHWCFYGKIQLLDEQIKKDDYIEDRQKHILHDFLFFSAVSRAFLEEYHDSRYMRWAVMKYRRYSEYVFFRKVELSPVGTAELTASANPYGLYRIPKDRPASVLEKYGLIKTIETAPETPVAAASPEPGFTDAAQRMPAQAPEPVPSTPPEAAPSPSPSP